MRTFLYCFFLAISAGLFAQNYYENQFEDFPDTLEFTGLSPIDTMGMPHLNLDDNSLIFETTNDPDNLFHGAYSHWTIKFDSLLNLSAHVPGHDEDALLPTFSIDLKATENCYVVFTLVAPHIDSRYGNNTDLYIDRPYNPQNNLRIEVPGDKQWHTFTYSFNNQFFDSYGLYGSSMGSVDSTQIMGVRFKINPGYQDYWAHESFIALATGSDSVYNHPYGMNYDFADGTGAQLWMDNLSIGKRSGIISTLNIEDQTLLYRNYMTVKLETYYDPSSYQLQFRELDALEWATIEAPMENNSWTFEAPQDGDYQFRAIGADTSYEYNTEIIHKVLPNDGKLYIDRLCDMPDTLLFQGGVRPAWPVEDIPKFTHEASYLKYETTLENLDFDSPFAWHAIQFDSLLNLSADEPGASDDALLPQLLLRMKSTETVHVYATFNDNSSHFGNRTDLWIADSTKANNHFEVPGDNQWHVFVHDFNEQFFDIFGNHGQSQGSVDSLHIQSVQFHINPGYTTEWAYKGFLQTGDDYIYNTPFGYGFDGSGVGATLCIDELVVGDVNAYIKNRTLQLDDTTYKQNESINVHVSPYLCHTNLNLRYRKLGTLNWTNVSTDLVDNAYWPVKPIDIGHYEFQTYSENDTSGIERTFVTQLVALDELSESILPTTFPNPFRNQISFSEVLLISLETIEVSNMLGTTVKKINKPEVSSIFLGELDDGYYQLIFHYKDGSNKTTRCLKLN